MYASAPGMPGEPSTLWAELGSSNIDDEDDGASSSVAIEMELREYPQHESERKSGRHVCERLTHSVLSAAVGSSTKDDEEDDASLSLMMHEEREEENLGRHLLGSRNLSRRNNPHVCERLTRSVLDAAGVKAMDDDAHEVVDLSRSSDSFPHLDTHRLLGSDGEEDEEEIEGFTSRRDTELESKVSDYWTEGGASNLDVFFTEAYEYYREHGMACIIASRVTDLITLGFTIIFSTFLFLFVEWRSLMKCDSEDTCSDLESYVSFAPLKSSGHSTWEVLVWSYFATLTIFWIWRFLLLLPTCVRAYRMRNFYLHRLHITTRQLETMQWDKVVDRLCRLQRSSRFKIQINKKDLNAHDIASRIMRTENYLIGMFNRNVFNLEIPLLCACFFKRPKNFFLTKHLEWNLKFCVVNHIFDESFAVREDFLRNAGALRRRFRLMAVVNFLFLPFILVFTVVHFFLKNAEEFHSSREYLGPREWSPMSLWRFREFNELRHVFETRMNKSIKPADMYVKQFQVPLLVIISKCVAFVVGAFLALLLAFTLLDENILLHVEFLDRNLLWWIAIFSGIIALSRSLIPKRLDSVFEPEEAIRNVAALTHFLPPEWIRKCRSYEVHESFLELYQYKVFLLLSEVASLLVVPLVLWFSLPRCAEDIVAFVRDYTTHVDGLGHVCAYSQFNLRKLGHPKYVGAVREKAVARNADPLRDSNFSVDGKMEKSFLNFKTQHPNWEPGAETGADIFLQQLSSFRSEMMAEDCRRAMARSKASSVGEMMSSSSIHTAMSRSFNGSERASLGPQPHRAFERDNCFSWLDRYFEHRMRRGQDIEYGSK